MFRGTIILPRQSYDDSADSRRQGKFQVWQSNDQNWHIVSIPPFSNAILLSLERNNTTHHFTKQISIFFLSFVLCDGVLSNISFKKQYMATATPLVACGQEGHNTTLQFNTKLIPKVFSRHTRCSLRDMFAKYHLTFISSILGEWLRITR